MRTRRRPASAADLHRQWLNLVDTDGPFLAVPPLIRVWPQGIGPISERAKSALIAAKPAFDAAWDQWDRDRFRDPESARDTFLAERDSWVEVIVRDVIGWGDSYCPIDGIGELAGFSATSPDRTVRVAPTGAVVRNGEVGALVWVIDPVDDLRDLVDDGWAASPIDRLEELLRTEGCPTTIGVVTDGRWWGLVSAAENTMTASGIFDSQTWVEEPASRNAFVAILQRSRLLGGPASDRLPELFKESVLAAEQITEALGVQVRRAVELIVSAFDESSRAARERGEEPLPEDGEVVYGAVVTVLMRVVFLLFAEERGLLPQGRLFEAGYGLGGVLDELQARADAEGEEAMGSSHLTWHRLLATSQALYEGASFEDMRLPAYGGSLFDPGRFPFLTATGERGTLTLAVSDRVMLHVLRAVQVARVKGQEPRRISFRDIDVEQIGYIYEGLLGYTCDVSPDLRVGLLGADGQEPEIPLDVLDDLAARHADDTKLVAAILAWVKEDQPSSKPPSASALIKAQRAGETLDDTELALRAVSQDQQLRDRLRPWIGIVRRDLRHRPVVIEAGGLLVIETPSRRNAGAHYTPRSLAEEVVEHALQPLVYSPGPHQLADPTRWRPISSNSILNLRIADIACGSGAFLVAAARYLAKKLVEAWHREGAVHGSPQETEVRALRAVVAQCLYGADINAMAVEMCKLSLWLVSLDKDLPFSFVDDKVLHGNSLLGITSLEQLKAMHIDPAAGLAQEALLAHGSFGIAERLDLDYKISNVRSKRQQLAWEVSEHDPHRTATAKHRLMHEITEELEPLRMIAHGVIAAGLPLGGKPGKKLNEAYENLRVAAGRAFPTDGDGDPGPLTELIKNGLTPSVRTDYDQWKPLHWPLAVPDVMERGGFDAIVGNPPFLGGQKLTGAMGTNIRDWFVNVLADGARGSSDLVGYFLLRAARLLTRRGNLGLIATNTVAQGDTRQVGLDRLVEQGFTITRSIQSRSWPAASANLEYAAVWGTRDRVAAEAPRVADDLAVRRISTLLEPAGRVDGHPTRLAENNGIAFIGCYVLGMGFVLDPAEAQQWIDEDQRNANVLLPYLNGEDLNSRPDCSASRWVIDFYDRTEQAASQYVVPFERLVSRVKDERQKVNRKALRDRWWQYAEKRPGLRKAVAALDEVLAIARVGKSVMPMRVPTRQVMSEQTVVFAIDSYVDQAVLSSSLHQVWAVAYGSTLETRVRYTPSDVFETFPRPGSTECLDAIGEILDTERREIMLRRDLGLTKLYNLINDPDITDADRDVARMREIHVELDHAVMAAYGWDDVKLDHGFHTYRQMQRWTVSPAARVEILDRLLEENHRRAAAQGEQAGQDHDGDDEGGED